MKIKQMIGAFGIAACCTGCVSSHVAWVEGWEPEVPEELDANCRFTSNGGTSAITAVLLNDACQPDEDAVEVSVFVNRRGEPESSRGLLAFVNNVVSCVTLGIWPYIRSQDQHCSVEIVAHGEKAERDFVVGHRVWSSFILPIGILPCPGWGDWRSSVTVSLDFEKGPTQEMWEASVAAGYVEEILTKEFMTKVKGKRERAKKAETPKAAPADKKQI